MATLRPQLDESRIHPSLHETIRHRNQDILSEVETAVEAHDIVVVGMAQNPHVKKVRRILEGAKAPFHYLEYGSYLTGWRRRHDLKTWTGWPTFPMVFVRGTFVGGAADVERLVTSGELASLLAGGEGRPSPEG